MKFVSKIIFVGSVLLSAPALGHESEWRTIGATTDQCLFHGRLDILTGYPFARFLVGEGSSEQIVSLVRTEKIACQLVQYGEVLEALEWRTYDVQGEFFCHGREPQYKVTQSLSGVQHTCLNSLRFEEDEVVMIYPFRFSRRLILTADQNSPLFEGAF